MPGGRYVCQSDSSDSRDCRIDMQTHPAAAVHGRSSTCHKQPCDRDGVRNHMTLIFDLLTSGSMHAERLL